MKPGPRERTATRRSFLTGLAGAAAALARAQQGSPIVDSHMHVWSNETGRFPFAHPYDASFKPPALAATGELLLEEMDRFAIAGCVLVQVIYYGWDNRYLVHCLKSAPRRFRGQGLIDPTDPEAARKLEHWMGEGLSGMRFSPIYYRDRDDWLNAPSSRALWETAQRLGAIFNFFIAADQLPKLEEMVRRFPAVPVVIDHFARVNLEGASAEGEVSNLLRLARYPSVSVKLSELGILSPSKAFPFRDTYPMVRRVFDAFGPDRMLWGTGFPGATRAQAGRPSLEEELRLVRDEIPFFSAGDRAKILGLNTARIWKLPAS